MANNNSIVIDYDQINYKEEAIHHIHNLPRYAKEYVHDLFPIFQWIHKYNLTWLIADLIAGITVGIVVVPQSMGYAKIAQLPPQYGLYSSFVGVCIYCFFATSKDITIGPTAVMSLLIGQTITHLTSSTTFTYSGPEIASALALFGGIVSVFIGLVRLGIVVDFIPNPAIAGFMTGSAITISIGQWPNLFGIKTVNTQDSAYLIFGHFFQQLPQTQVDVAFGLVGLVWLYGVRFGANYLTRRYPKYERTLFFINIMRNGILVIFGTLIAYLINIGKSTSPISILKTVPAGFTAMGVPNVEISLLQAIAPNLPSVVLILILEHVAIAKSFGRINDYRINPNQEIIALGVSNIIGSFFGAYPNTGSFSRTAIKARSGVRTPIAGIFSGCVVVLALYALTPAFYYIPSAILAAVIIHAVSDLVSGPKFIKQLWYINPLELFTFVAAVIITFFTTVEYGIYTSAALSIVILLIRIARPRYSVLGRIPINGKEKKDGDNQYLYVSETHPSLGRLVEPVTDGVIIFRFDEALTYPNSSFVADRIIEQVRERTRRGKPLATNKGDRPWNDNSSPKDFELNASKSRLAAVVIDFATVNNVDSTGIQTLLDVQSALNKYADRNVQWHFANINSPFIRNALLAGGFGSQTVSHPGEILPVVPASRDGPKQEKSAETTSSVRDIEEAISEDGHKQQEIHEELRLSVESDLTTLPGYPVDKYPFFHWNLEEAVRAASATAVISNQEN
ncbi:sulfate transporter family-domain-containing protein [Umbelopsis sp. PMI_123]|nr:sulfate transporter family-domain-containing protein [Umbelopsis sp. PMI_123]